MFQDLRLAKKVMVLVGGLGLFGCTGVPVHQQRLVARPNMQFASSPTYTDAVSVLSQIETGAAASGGAQAAGCTSCR